MSLALEVVLTIDEEIGLRSDHQVLTVAPILDRLLTEFPRVPFQALRRATRETLACRFDASSEDYDPCFDVQRCPVPGPDGEIAYLLIDHHTLQ